MTLLRSAGILTGPNTHLDHLGVLCTYLEIPLIVTDPQSEKLAHHYYPDLNVIQKLPVDLSLDSIASSYDVLFHSGKFWAIDLKPLFQMLFSKRPILVFAPHGHSDKGHSVEQVDQDIILFYGTRMLEFLKEKKILERTRYWIETGNYRLAYYMKHKNFYDQLFEKEIGSKLDKNKKNLLYAPSWQCKENPTSFFEKCGQIINENKGEYNLIIKLHPFLEERYPGQTWHLISQYETADHTHFIHNFPPIYPLLAHIDAYIGDFSSIGYDFLYFDKPLFFFLPKNTDPKTPGCFLHSCGMTINEEEKIIPFIKTHLEENQNKFSQKRKEVYGATFGPLFHDLKKEIFIHLAAVQEEEEQKRRLIY